MQMTITEAAKLYGKQRKTLYRHINAGRLSCSVRGDGHRVIDLSEMIRCYGEAPTPVNTSDTAVTRVLLMADALHPERNVCSLFGGLCLEAVGNLKKGPSYTVM